MVYGTNCRVKPLAPTRKQIAAYNTLTMLNASEQIYSHVADFCWSDENGEYQTDWRLFSKDNFTNLSAGRLLLNEAGEPRRFFGK